MKWSTIVSVQDENDKKRFFRVTSYLYTAKLLYPGKNMCKIEAAELSKDISQAKQFHFYVNLTDTLVVISSDKTMPTYFILHEMDKLVKAGKEQW